MEAIGVTRTLVEANMVDDTYFSDIAAGRGRMVHYFAERIATNTLDRPIDASIVGEMTGFRKFLDKYAPTIHNAETIVCNPNRLIAGTIDLDVTLLGGLSVVEIKRSTPTAWHGLQLAPYAYCLDGPKWSSRARFGLYLNARGGFRLKEYDETDDLDVFLRAHEILAWRLNHGKNGQPYGRRDRADVSNHNGGQWRNGDDGDSFPF